MDAATETALADNYARAGDQAGLESFYKAQLAALQGSALERSEKNTRVARLRRGMIGAAARLGNWGDATDQYIELINAYPGDAPLAQEAALHAAAHGQREKLIGFYRKTADTSPRDARWSMVLARLETALEDYPAAIKSYGNAIRIRPEQKDLYQSRADLEERLHRLDDAVTDYEQLYKLSYRDPQWKLKAAEARARQGRNADAVKELDEAWIAGRPPKAANDFEVARRLEQWGLLDEARKYAEQGVERAGADLLTDPGNQTGAALYARIMARLRQSDAAFTRLAAARKQAVDIPLTAVAQQVLKDGIGAVTDEDWRKQRVEQRTQQSTAGFAQAVQSIGAVVGEYGTPEEKTQFATWLQAKRAGVNESELRAVYLPTVRAAGLVDMDASLRWELAQKSRNPDSGDLDSWLQLERKRVQLEVAGGKMEALASSLPPQQQPSLWQKIARVYRTVGDAAAELRVMEKQSGSGWLGAGELPRFFRLLLAARPQELEGRASTNTQGAAQKASADSSAQYLLENGKPDQALAGIASRSVGLPAVWKKAYTGLTGLYLREHNPQVRAGFNGALGADATIGERIAQPADRDEQLAGAVWFYYGSRYGAYLDEEKDPKAEGYLEAELEHTPESAKVYLQLADYSAQAGRESAALADYQHALDLKSDQPAALDSMAAIAWKQGRQADAVAAWQKAVQLLAAEMDARRVPETFWGDFTQVLGNAAGHGQYAAISQQVDAMLRVYVARNGAYRVESLLQAGYHAHGDSMDWLLAITAAASDPASVLNNIQGNYGQENWVLKSQMSHLYARIVELERCKATVGEENYGLEHAESRLIDALLDEKKYAEARAELARIPEERRIAPQWLGLELRLADAEGRLPQLVAAWKKQPANAPGSNTLQSEVARLGEAPRRIVMRFTYERALDARELTAPNFLGLAALDLDEGDVIGAVALLKRLKLVSANAYADADAAASLLETRSHYAEAIPFLQPLAEASPWNADLKVRLAVAHLAGNAQSQPALAALTAVAADPKAKYGERVAAAKALHGLGAPTAGSAELQLLARAACPSADEASQPYFVEARGAAAACAANDKVRERVLRSAVAAVPDRMELRLQYVWAAFAAGQDARALVAAEPILSNGSFYGQAYAQEDDSADSEAGAAPQQISLKPEEMSRLTWLAIHAREKRQETDKALALVRSRLPFEPDTARRNALEEEKKRLETEAARDQENSERAPKIHAELDQASVVRPRLLPGMPFVPKKSASGEGDAE
jgi:tetratricopeptide (TPR) repeat protein